MTATAGGAATLPAVRARRSGGGRRRGRHGGGWRSALVAAVFLLPALVLLGALVAWPILYTIIRSLYDRSGDSFVGFENYGDVFSSGRTLIALRNNVIWVVVAPTLVTAVGLVFAVLSERVRWSTAFKVVVFMPMAISFLSAGIIFRLVYEQDPDRGLANAVLTSVRDAFGEPARYPGARPRPDGGLTVAGDGAVVTSDPVDVASREVVLVPLVGLSPDAVGDDADEAVAADGVAGSGVPGVSGVVWLDFARGGRGAAGEVDDGELGLPEMKVELVRGGSVVATTSTAPDGSFSFATSEAGSGPVLVRLAASNFREAFNGVTWLGPTLVTPAVIVSYLWIWAGFAMVVIAAGLAAIPRDVLEAARVDGANEWQVFRRVTVPLLAPVLAVVAVTLMINVLKVFDLVLVIPPASLQDDANVVALEMWRVSFGGARDQGLGSALGVLLFVLVVPAMLFNVRRFRREAS